MILIVNFVRNLKCCQIIKDSCTSCGSVIGLVTGERVRVPTWVAQLSRRHAVARQKHVDAFLDDLADFLTVGDPAEMDVREKGA